MPIYPLTNLLTYQVDQLLRATVPSTQRSILMSDEPTHLEGNSLVRAQQKKGPRRSVARGAAPPVPATAPSLRLPTPSPDLLRKHQVAHQEAIRRDDPLAPLCMDHRALKHTQDTTTGTAMALPGTYFLTGGMAANNPGLV